MSRTVVVGAGIVGAAIAFELKRRGKDVVLVDRDTPGRGASFGNMASIAVTEFPPISRPSTWAKIPGWLTDPEGPIRLRPGYAPKLLPWMLRFLAAGRPSKVAELEQAGAVLCRRVYDDLLPMLEALGMSDALSENGCLSLYANDAEYAADLEHIELSNRFGFHTREVGREELRELEPAISSVISKAVLFPTNKFVRDPYQLVLALVATFQQMGGLVRQGAVSDIDTVNGQVRAVVLDNGQRIECSELVLAAGAYTGRLSALIGENIPMETERGYHTQIMVPGIALKHSLIWQAKAFMVTPTAGGIRVGGTVELAGLDAAPDYRRAKVLVKRAQIALPQLQAEGASEWMGHRPALPDTIPVIGPSAKVGGVFYAAGHGHLGLTYSATTARLMADLLTGQTPPVDMTPYRVDRF
ncbi:FAD-binding oxidoreductase [Vogesella sp. LYT5W]|uniref:FAD-binding oxidoreductase n=1 Tax=Vogesella margarita TaxID=2984199 RepID=A0ABT5IM60_9NEIS|nr:FAD-binding oxidoreductase [Vogesella margarita]MDC7713647.1 FAD-binding oxidoreductase [Vogesella margarita]